jgi:hypothetical protein
MAEHVSAIYNSTRVTKFTGFSAVINTMPYFRSLFPKKTSTAQDMALCIHQAVLGVTPSSVEPGTEATPTPKT